jgi:hypothetical protein
VIVIDMEGPSPKNSRYQAVPASEVEDHEATASATGRQYGNHSRDRSFDGQSFAQNSIAGSTKSPAATNGHDRYQKIPNGHDDAVNDNHNGYNDDDSDEVDHAKDHETNSLVDDVRSPASRMVFRATSWSENDAQRQQPREISIRVDAATGTAHDGYSVGSNNHHHNMPSIRPTTASSPLHSNSVALSRNVSRDSASLGSSTWDEDDDDDDDVVNLRRYQLDFTAARDVPLPAEFHGHTVVDRLRYVIQQYSTLAWHNWRALRQAARQRRAARLLTMPSETIRYKLHACFLSWCCDATDMGIACTAVCILVWILVGVLASHSTVVSSRRYWLAGATLFVIRVTARRLYEAGMGYVAGRRRLRQLQRQQQQQQRGRLGSRQRLGSITAVDDDNGAEGTITLDSLPATITNGGSPSRKNGRNDAGNKNSSNPLPPTV